MSKPSGISWFDYISQSPYVSWQNSDDYIRFMQLSASLQAMVALYHGDLRYKNVAKIIICEPTQPVAIQKGHPPFCFRFQCVTTGRVSKYIKEDDYSKFGITKEDAIKGTGYGARQSFPNKFKPIIERTCKRMQELTSIVRDGASWWDRYSEYLASEEWAAVRERILERDSWACRVTGKTNHLQIHHLTYRHVGAEIADELVTLNAEVHKAVHNGRDPNHAKYIEALQRSGFAAKRLDGEHVLR